MARKPKEKPGVVVYWDMFDTLDRVKPEKVKPLLKAIRNFSQNGEVPNFDGDEALELVWPMMEQKLIADGARYEEIRQQRINAINARWEKERAKEQDGNESIQPNTDVYKRIRGIPETETNSKTERKTDTKTERETETGDSAPTPAPLTFGRYNNVHLTDVEFADLKAEYPGKWEAMIENLSAKLAVHGYKFENHLATMRLWADEDAQKERTNARSKPLSQRFDMCDGITIDDYDNDIPLPL